MVKGGNRVGLVSGESTRNAEREESGDLLTKGVTPPKKDYSPRPGDTFQHQNPPTVRRVL